MLARRGTLYWSRPPSQAPAATSSLPRDTPTSHCPSTRNPAHGAPCAHSAHHGRGRSESPTDDRPSHTYFPSNRRPRQQPSTAERQGQAAGSACKNVDALQTKMAAPASFSRWFGVDLRTHDTDALLACSNSTATC